jgi:pyruvate dehydrogenase complex dehydrogenase (E1) component
MADSLDAVLAFDGPDRATFLLDELIGEAHRHGVTVRY